MKYFLFIILLFLSNFCFSQAQDAQKTDSIYRVVDSKAEFPGGTERMNGYVQSRLKSDQSTWDVKEGVITIECIIDKDGRIREATILKGIDPTFDDNFVLLFKGMPKWKPAMVKGQPVRSYFKYSFTMNYVMH